MYGHGQSRKLEIFLLAAHIDFRIFDYSNSEVSLCHVPRPCDSVGNLACQVVGPPATLPFRKLVAK